MEKKKLSSLYGEMRNKCIMPNQPYCPACMYGYIYESPESEDCEWHCLAPINKDDGQPITWEHDAISHPPIDNR